ncbi:sensor histidine kinase [Tabrizicola piscis]|uniref:histidine kinase n=1 Tax=Tabrizicola piscis TaxID=2494374 RepID=A0A3S8U5X8_9RHOB|nr:HAMP domain-containing sensor histidine kinase [Tabrizicola piscis]AZL58955.1 sensor histidine kinase [Tabrizicola piscis]
MTRRWRPNLAFVLGGALAGTLGLSFAGLIALRYLGPEIGFRNAAILLAAAIALATAVLAWLLVRLLLRPIRALETYAVAAETGSAAVPPLHFGTRELHATARRVIAMAETLRDREAAVRAFSDHVTHEFRTPVSAILAAAELLADGGTLTPADAALVGQIEGASAQIEAQLAALRNAVRAREARYTGSSTLSDLLRRLSDDWPALQLDAEGDSMEIPIGEEGLNIVLTQLFRNAVENGASAISLRAVAHGPEIQLLVADDGTGISAGNAPRVFDPFFTTRREAGGTGMGLAIVRNLLQAHGASIALAPSAKGTTFLLTFLQPEA